VGHVWVGSEMVTRFRGSLLGERDDVRREPVTRRVPLQAEGTRAWQGGRSRVTPYFSRTIRVVELSSNSTTSDRDRMKSLKDLKPKDFSLNDGSIRFI
jgi:hypothetical protein